MQKKKIIAVLAAAALYLTPLTSHIRPLASVSVSASAETISDIPQDYLTACDWVWKNRIETERSCEAWSTIYDQIIAGNGTLQYILIWQSYEPITLAQRQKLPQMLEEAINKWNDCLVGYDDWPIDHVNVKVVGYAVLDESCILDRQPDEKVYTQTTTSWLHDDMVSSGMGNSSVPTIQPAEPTALSRYVHWNNKNWNYNGSYDNRYDMYLHGIKGMINMGGYGYHYGQILSDQSVLGLIDGTTTQHILLHEMGHGFGFPDYYGGEGESDGFPPGGFPGGKGSIMMAGSCSYINTFDKYFARYTWSKLKNEAGRFDLKNVQPAASTAEFTDKITAINIQQNGYSAITFENNGTYRFPVSGYFDSTDKDLSFYEVGDTVSISFTYDKSDMLIKNIDHIQLISYDPIKGTLISKVSVIDTDYYNSWGIDTYLQKGDVLFGDRTADRCAVTELPDSLIGAEAVLTPCDAKSSSKEQAAVTANKDITLYVGLDSRVTNVPSWLGSFTKTSRTVKTSNNVTFLLYSKKVNAGESVKLGANGQSAGCMNYIVLASAAANTSISDIYPEITDVAYSEQYHQIRFTWKPVDGASNYGIAVYLAGKWRIQTQNISASATSYTTPKNLTAGKTYKVAVAAKVNGEWTAEQSIKHAVTVTVR